MLEYCDVGVDDICEMTYGFVLAAALRAVDAFLGEGVADALQSTAFAELAANEVVDAVLGLVDWLDAGDLGLVEGVCLFDRCQSG
jgi:hypothetical protein